jgi:hypothetical protein
MFLIIKEEHNLKLRQIYDEKLHIYNNRLSIFRDENQIKKVFIEYLLYDNNSITFENTFFISKNKNICINSMYRKTLKNNLITCGNFNAYVYNHRNMTKHNMILAEIKHNTMEKRYLKCFKNKKYIINSYYYKILERCTNLPYIMIENILSFL